MCGAPVARARRAWWRNLVELVVCSAIAVMLLECLFDAVGLGRSEFMEPDRKLGARHIAGKLVTYHFEGHSSDKISSVGLRDVEHTIAKPAGITRIALLGDSATEGMQVPLTKTYARRLEALLNEGSAQPKYEVINFGASSYSTVQQILQYQLQAAQYKPDIVVLMYNRGDSLENVFVPGPAAAAQPRPYAYLDGHGNLQFDHMVLKACDFKLRPDPVMSFLRRNSRIYGVFSEANLALSINEHDYRKFTALLTNIQSKIPFLDAKVKVYNKPYPAQDGLKVTDALIQELNKEVTAAGGRFVLVLFPNNVGDPDFTRQESYFRKMAEAKHIDFIDLTRPFMNTTQYGHLFLEYHFSAAGHRLVAEQLNSLIRSFFKPDGSVNDGPSVQRF